MRARVAFVTMIVLVISRLGAAIAVAQTPSATTSHLLEQCDRAYESGDLNASLARCREILIQIPDSYDASWRMSRALIGQGNLSEDIGKKREYFGEARSYAEFALQADSSGSQGFTCLAVASGSLSSVVGARRGIELAEEARAAAERAISLDERNDLAYLVLGVWHREVSSLGGFKKLAAKIFYGGIPKGASLDESEACLRRAVQLEPQRINHHRELGITLLAKKRYSEAVQAFESAARLAPKSPADHLYLEDARERLELARLRAQEQR